MKHKLIMENWRRFVEEVEGEEQDAAAVTGRSEKLLGLKLPAFVAKMNSQMPEDMAALMRGLEDGDIDDDKITITPTNVAVKGLIPTQSEVVWGKSIDFALERPEVFKEYYTSNGPFNVGKAINNAIVTLNGKYIMDGHHRWSSLFCVNPNASMATFNITATDIDPLEMLNLMQASIKKNVGKKNLPSAKGGGTNLFTIGAKGIKGNVIASLKKNPELVKQFIQLDFLSRGPTPPNEEKSVVSEAGNAAATIATQLIGIYTKNIKQMRDNNAPVTGASTRPTMPQTDKVGPVVAGGEIPAGLAPLDRGEVDHEDPFKK